MANILANPKDRQVASLTIPCTRQELFRFRVLAKKHGLTHRAILLTAIARLETQIELGD